jgi:hypothetical protein
MDRVAVPNTRINEPFMYCPRTVSRICLQLSAGMVRCKITSAMGRNKTRPITKAEIVQALSLK